VCFRGFSLIELCITIAIMGIGFLLMMPNVNALSQHIELVSCSNDIYQLIQHTKILSVSQKQPYWLHFLRDSSHSGKHWQIILTDSGDITPKTTITVIDDHAYPHILINVAYPSHQIVFSALRGKISSGHIEIQAKTDSQEKVKIITSYGAARVRVCTEGSKNRDWPAC